MQPWTRTDATVAQYHARQVRLDLWIIAALTAMGAIRIQVAWEPQYRWALVPLGLAFVALGVGANLPLARLLARPAVQRFLPAGYAAALVFLFAFTVVDSEALAIYPAGAMVIVMAASALFRPRTILGLGLLGLAGYFGLAAVVAQPSTVLVVSLSMILSVVVGLCVLTAHNRGLQDTQRTAAERRTEALLENGSDAVLAVADGHIRFASSSTGRILGHDAGSFTVGTLMDMTHPDDVAEATRWVQELRAAAPGHTSRRESRCRHADGRWITVEVIGTNRVHDPDLGVIVLTIRDVSAQKALEGELTRQAFEDSLTGLPNRALLGDRMNHAVARNLRNGGRVELLLVDLDDFKKVNDTLGHAAGDELIRVIATRMGACIRPSDTLARLGGDEFALLVEGLDDLELATLAERILEVVRLPVRVGNRDLVTTASIGIASAKVTGTVAETETHELLRDADLAMYAAKTAGRDRYVIFDESMYADALQEAEARLSLEQALADNEFVVFYQPIVDLPSGDLIGVEALVRRLHPELGLLGPDTFIPLAEKTGLIVPLGQWILTTACTQAAAWHRDVPGAERLRVSINLSARQFQDTDLVQDVAEALRTSGIEASRVVLEITESLLMQDTDATISTLRRLRELGVQIAIDDFGTGYSSLSYLRRFPIDILKIDKAFIDGIATDPDDATLAEAVVHLGQALRLQTVAEGIENADQHTLLSDLGCTYGQGFLFARPAASAEIEALLRHPADAAVNWWPSN
ncbi:putative bifunctional diguanylate cyclase/phosphodiesterase [Actinoplanes friuliensis]|uniref:Putative signaling protein n=1 Tax=Actinoplanes friuliensis DSM 7358 TaxID=1246995 RepID=U5W3R9_9ACTN|nr:EAL domain-containing protein [Actinoplanes friuliensis]AGZ43868.1 putative signaling protein [Actinoplanes friuliensis DSM 7358]